MKYLALAAVLAVCVASAVPAQAGCGGHSACAKALYSRLRRVGSVVVAPFRAVRSRAKARGC